MSQRSAALQRRFFDPRGLARGQYGRAGGGAGRHYRLLGLGKNNAATNNGRSPDEGEVRVKGEPMQGIDEAAKGDLRNRCIGFVYQFHHLLPEFTAQENVAMPLLIRRDPKPAALEQARELLGRVGLGERLNHKPGELSGGERQRAAVARALITRPQLVLADEPTGNLDAGNGEHVLKLMLELNEELQTSLVIVTHDHSIARRMDRILVLENGALRESV